MPMSSVQTLIKKWKMRDSVETKLQSGFQPQLPGSIVQDEKKDPQITSADIQDSLKKCGVAVSRCTVRRHYKKNGLHGRVARRKPLLHTKQPAYDKPQNFWNKVIWSDETQI